MGDRCYWTATAREQDAEAFGKIFDQQPVDWSDHAKTLIGNGTTFEDCEANYGNYDQMKDASEAGLTFFGVSYEGSNYGSLVFYSNGTSFHSWPTGHGGEGWCVEVGDDGIVSSEELTRLGEFVRGYFKTKKRVEEGT